MSTTHPVVTEGLEVNEADDGLVVFRADTETVHYLNGSASVIFTLCDGSRDAGSIAAFLAKGFGLAAPPLEETERCLAKLVEDGLIH